MAREIAHGDENSRSVNKRNMANQVQSVPKALEMVYLYSYPES